MSNDIRHQKRFVKFLYGWRLLISVLLVSLTSSGCARFGKPVAPATYIVQITPNTPAPLSTNATVPAIWTLQANASLTSASGAQIPSRTALPYITLPVTITYQPPTVAVPIITSTANQPTPTATSTSTELTPTTPTPTPTPTQLTQTAVTVTSTHTPTVGVTANVGVETLNLLRTTNIEPRNSRLIAERLGIATNIPEVVASGPPSYVAEQEVEFNASNVDTTQNFKLKARLAYTSAHVYFFVDSQLAVDNAAVKKLVDKFESNIYPTTRATFGSEWSPGVDADPHLYILYARGLGFGVAGFFSAADEYSRLAVSNSNEKEMFYINADTVPLDSTYHESILAHEFQHMIHWANDRNEEAWLNEGASELSAIINGYGSNFITSFLSNPDVQLNTWDVMGNNSPHYGGSALFLKYFLDRFGTVATTQLVGDTSNGLPSVQNTLNRLNLLDSLRGKVTVLEDLFADWTVANYLKNSTLLDGRYGYKDYPNLPSLQVQHQHSVCPLRENHDVRQFATDYHQFSCNGSYVIRFEGSQTTSPANIPMRQGNYFVWSNRADNSETNLTRAIDLTSVQKATLNYAIWYAIEPNYDYAYLQVSTNNGQTWQIIPTARTTTAITTNSYGPGYNGYSGNGDGAWVQESVDLSAYAGSRILVRWEYITDDAVTLAGFALDEISIPEIGLSENFENYNPEWQMDGFVRIDNRLPQKFRVQLIQERSGGTPVISDMLLSPDNIGEMQVQFLSGEKTTLIVSAITEYSTQPANYVLEIK
jgi:hypothetical protein